MRARSRMRLLLQSHDKEGRVRAVFLFCGWRGRGGAILCPRGESAVKTLNLWKSKHLLAVRKIGEYATRFSSNWGAEDSQSLVSYALFSGPDSRRWMELADRVNTCT